MKASSNGNIFRVTGPLCGEFTGGHRWIPRTKASDAELWCFLGFAPWINGWVNNRETGDLRRHCAHYDAIVMLKFSWFDSIVVECRAFCQIYIKICMTTSRLPLASRCYDICLYLAVLPLKGHWGPVIHICVSKLIISGSNGVSPSWHQAIIWTNAGLLLIGTVGINFREILNEIHTFSYKKMQLIMSVKWRPFCLGLNVLMNKSPGTHFTNGLRAHNPNLVNISAALEWKIIRSDHNSLQWRHNERQITCLTIVYSTVYSGADQRKHQSSASLAFVRGINRRAVNSPHKWPVTRKMFPFDDVIMCIYTTTAELSWYV